MAQHDTTAPDKRNCTNCRYRSLTAGPEVRCADPTQMDFDRVVTAQSGCDRFQISFAAAKKLAFEGKGPTPLDEAWEKPMRQHLSLCATPPRALHS